MADTRYAQVARDLAERIASGEFPVGSILPKEVDLAESYGVSRYTLRSAIAELQQLGLVSRRRKLGTKVEAEVPSGHYRQSLTSVEDLVQYGATHSRVLRNVEEIVADEYLAGQIGCKPGTRWLRISFVRLDGTASGLPMGWTDVYVDALSKASKGLGELVRAAPDQLIATLLENHYGHRIEKIRQDVQGASVPPELAEALQAAPGSEALKIVRRYLDPDGCLLDVSVTIHPADRYTLSMELNRERASFSTSKG
jgi:DNA-binding GntR family transcriptional regulator